jgi:phosphoribosyl-ATP pyrophosphohydrolase
MGEVIREIGMIIEHRNNRNFKQTNYCYLAKLVGEKGEPSFTEKEIEEGFELIWVSLDEAEKLFQGDSPDQYSAQFQGYRDKLFLHEAKKILAL